MKKAVTQGKKVVYIEMTQEEIDELEKLNTEDEPINKPEENN